MFGGGEAPPPPPPPPPPVDTIPIMNMSLCINFGTCSGQYVHTCARQTYLRFYQKYFHGIQLLFHNIVHV